MKQNNVTWREPEEEYKDSEKENILTIFFSKYAIASIIGFCLGLFIGLMIGIYWSVGL